MGAIYFYGRADELGEWMPWTVRWLAKLKLTMKFSPLMFQTMR
jgi:hypothetical protein